MIPAGTTLSLTIERPLGICSESRRGRLSWVSFVLAFVTAILAGAEIVTGRNDVEIFPVETSTRRTRPSGPEAASVEPSGLKETANIPHSGTGMVARVLMLLSKCF